MSKQALRFLLLVLIGWYVAGPLAEAVDRWDDVRSEVGDLARSAGGAVTIVMAGLGLAVALLRQLKARCAFPARAFRSFLEPEISSLALPLAASVASASHSPPVSLRI